MNNRTITSLITSKAKGSGMNHNGYISMNNYSEILGSKTDIFLQIHNRCLWDIRLSVLAIILRYI